MISAAKNTLIEINRLSRQILSRINDVQENIHDIPTAQTSVNTHAKSTNNDLTQLTAQRQNLIVQLFEQSSLAVINAELPLLNEMLAFDTELSTKSKACKNAFAEQIIKLKKSQKITNSYQKY